MAFSLSKRSAQDSAVVFDIGSGSVGAAYVVFEHESAPTVVASTREPITVQQNLAIDRFLKLLERATGRCAARIRQELAERGATPSNIHCVFASPWYVTKTTRIANEREETFVISENYLDELVDSATDAFTKDPERASREELIGKGMLMEQDILQVTANGYPTSRPEGKEAFELSLALFMSALSHDVHERVMRALQDEFADQMIYFHSFVLAAYTVIRDNVSPTGDFLMIDVSGEVTDVALVREGVLTQTGTFPCGKNTLIRAIMKARSTTAEEAASSVRRFLAGMQSEAEASRMKKELAAEQKKWCENLKEAISHLTGDVAPPSEVYITAEAPFGRWYKDAAAGGEAPLFPRAVLISPKFLNEYVASEMEEFDVFLGIGALHVYTKHYAGALPEASVK